MPSLIQGRLIYPKIAVPDPQGQNPKAGRPFVVVTINEDIKKGGPVYAVGITSTFDESQAELYVQLPYGPYAKSGLKIKSAAHCMWVIDISRDQFDIGQGFIPPRLVDEIADKVELLKAQPRVIRDDPA